MRSFSVVITIAILNPYLIIPAFFGLLYMVYIGRTGIKAMHEAQRLDFLQQGPINQTYAMVISGLITLRAYKCFDYYKNDFLNSLETGANSTFCYNVMNRWIGIRLDSICTVIAIVTAVFCVIFKGKMDADLLIFSL